MPPEQSEPEVPQVQDPAQDSSSMEQPASVPAKKPWLARKWQRRLGWLCALAFGLGVYKLVVTLNTNRGTSRSLSREEALEALVPRVPETVLPLKTPLISSSPEP